MTYDIVSKPLVSEPLCVDARQALRTCGRNCNKIHLLAGPVCEYSASLLQVLQR